MEPMATSEQSFFPHRSMAGKDSPAGGEHQVRRWLSNAKSHADVPTADSRTSPPPQPPERRVGICQSSQVYLGPDPASDSCKENATAPPVFGAATAQFGTVTAQFGTGTEPKETFVTGTTTFGPARGVSLPPIGSSQTDA